MEYILFGTGIIIIITSLFLTYRQKSSGEEDYYLQSELLSEIREVKEGIKEQEHNLNEQEFKKVFDDEVNNQQKDHKLTNIILKVEDKIVDLEEKIDRLENKINYSLSNSVSLSKKAGFKEEVKAEHKEYQKIKELVEQGFSLTEAAQKLDMGTREVRLIWKFNSRGEE